MIRRVNYPLAFVLEMEDPESPSTPCPDYMAMACLEEQTPSTPPGPTTPPGSPPGEVEQPPGPPEETEDPAAKPEESSAAEPAAKPDPVPAEEPTAKPDEVPAEEPADQPDDPAHQPDEPVQQPEDPDKQPEEPAIPYPAPLDYSLWEHAAAMPNWSPEPPPFTDAEQDAPETPVLFQHWTVTPPSTTTTRDKSTATTDVEKRERELLVGGFIRHYLTDSLIPQDFKVAVEKAPGVEATASLLRVQRLLAAVSESQLPPPEWTPESEPGLAEGVSLVWQALCTRVTANAAKRASPASASRPKTTAAVQPASGSQIPGIKRPAGVRPPPKGTTAAPPKAKALERNPPPPAKKMQAPPPAKKMPVVKDASPVPTAGINTSLNAYTVLYQRRLADMAAKAKAGRLGLVAPRTPPKSSPESTPTAKPPAAPEPSASATGGVKRPAPSSEDDDWGPWSSSGAENPPEDSEARLIRARALVLRAKRRTEEWFLRQNPAPPKPPPPPGAV